MVTEYPGFHSMAGGAQRHEIVWVIVFMIAI
jgi:hypothetical protein